MAQLLCDETAKERRAGGIYVSRCTVLSVSLLIAFLFVACASLLLLLWRTSAEVEVHRVIRQIETSATSPAPASLSSTAASSSSSRPKRITPFPASAGSSTQPPPSSSPSSSSSSIKTSTISSTTAEITKEDDNPEISLRLSRDIRPFHYDIHWKPDIYQPTRDAFTANATAQIHLRCYSVSAVISLDYRHLVFDSFSFVVVNRSDNSVIPIDIICADRDDETYNITLVRRLAVGEEVMLTMKYTVFIQEGSTADAVVDNSYLPSNIGLFTGRYSTGNDTRFALFTQMKTTESRRTFPSFDDPDVKATFTISIDREKHLRALSNTPVNYTYSVNRSSNWVTDVFETTKPMSTYLVAFAISDYTNVTVHAGCSNVTINLWAPDDFVRAGYLDYATSVAAAAVNFYEDYLDYSYSWSKLDLASIPGKDFGGMANSALIFFQSSYLLFDERRSDSEDRLNVASSVSRLIAHSWLGNVVTIKWWDDLWITEGMTRYLQFLGIQSVHPSWDVEQLFVAEVFYNGAMWIDDLGQTPAVYNSMLKTWADLDKQFNDITINKGACLMRMLSNLIGEDEFQMALQECIIDYEFSNIDHNELFAEITKASNESGDGLDFNVTDVLLTWIVQTHYPLVTVGRPQNNGSSTQLNITQAVYLYATNQTADDLKPSPYGYQWEIPITYITSYDPNPVRVWMHKDKQIVVTLPQPLSARDWVLVNHNLFGFYRVNYDDANWMALVAQLKSNHTKIPINNRAQIFDDCFTLPVTGHMSQVTCLQLTEYLANETEYLPWKRFQDNIAYVLFRIFDDVRLYTRLQNYILSRLRNNYDVLGWENASNDNITTTLLRRLILEMAGSADYDAFVTKATGRFQLWKASGFNNTLITPDQRFAVYCAVAARGNYDDYQLLASRYQATLSHFSSESDRLARALTCTRNVTTIKSLLESIQNQQVNIVAQHDQVKVLSYVALSMYGYNATWDHLAKYGSSTFRRVDILGYLSNMIATSTEAAKFSSYVAQYPAQNKDEREMFASFWDIIQLNIRWRQRYQRDISDWLTTLNL